MTRTLRVLVADDSPFVGQLLTSYLEAPGDMEVVAVETDGARAVDATRRLRPDVVTLDMEMPHCNGLEALRTIMAECPTPCVVISGASGRGATMTLQALDSGAVDFVLKYQPGQHLDPDQLRHEIVAKVRAASKIRVVRNVGLADRPNAVQSPSGPPAPGSTVPRPRAVGEALDRVVIVGASTGGPLALRRLLESLPSDFGAAMVIVQHMPASFTGVLAAQLDRSVPLPVREAEDGDALEPGTVFVAPGGRHLLCEASGHVRLRRGAAIGGHCPSIDVAMQSAARAFGHRAAGLVLTGMGSDGAKGLLAIHAEGGLTLAQDEATCVVYGMPKRAMELGVVDHQSDIPGMVQRLLVAPPASTPGQSIPGPTADLTAPGRSLP